MSAQAFQMMVYFLLVGGGLLVGYVLGNLLPVNQPGKPRPKFLPQSVVNALQPRGGEVVARSGNPIKDLAKANLVKLIDDDRPADVGPAWEKARPIVEAMSYPEKTAKP